MDSDLLQDFEKDIVEQTVKIDKLECLETPLVLLEKEIAVLTKLEENRKVWNVANKEPVWKLRTNGYWQFLYHRSHPTTFRPPASNLAAKDKPATTAQWTLGQALLDFTVDNFGISRISSNVLTELLFIIDYIKYFLILINYKFFIIIIISIYSYYKILNIIKCLFIIIIYSFILQV